MLRNTILYHRLWYIRKRNLRRFQLYIPVMLFVIIVTFSAVYIDKRVLPEVMDKSETEAAEEISAEIKEIVDNDFQDELKFEKLMTTVTDETGRISAVRKNTAGMNSISRLISDRIDERLSHICSKGITLPSGTVFGQSIISLMRTDFDIAMTPDGKTRSVIDSDVYPVPDNGLRCVSKLEVRVGVILRFMSQERKKEIIT
jgi:sporulation protein YunB